MQGKGTGQFFRTDGLLANHVTAKRADKNSTLHCFFGTAEYTVPAVTMRDSLQVEAK
jgi:hypothetical protein